MPTTIHDLAINLGGQAVWDLLVLAIVTAFHHRGPRPPLPPAAPAAED